MENVSNIYFCYLNSVLLITLIVINQRSKTTVLNPPQAAEIFNANNSLNPHKTCNYNISVAFLCLGNAILAPIVTLYFAVAFEHDFFSQSFKTAKIIYLFKAGKKKYYKQLLTNIHTTKPIKSIGKNDKKSTDKIWKIETVALSAVVFLPIKNRLLNFFEKHQILYYYSYAFKEKHCTLQALLRVA